MNDEENIRMQATINLILRQRDIAQGDSAQLAGENAVLLSRINALEAEKQLLADAMANKELKPKPD